MQVTHDEARPTRIPRSSVGSQAKGRTLCEPGPSGSGGERRSITRGALYRTLDRLTEKGLLAWELEPSQIPERGGHPMRRLHLTERGIEAVRETREVLDSFLEGLGPALDDVGR